MTVENNFRRTDTVTLGRKVVSANAAIGTILSSILNQNLQLYMSGVISFSNVNVLSTNPNIDNNDQYSKTWNI